MKIIHISDLHFGKMMYGYSMAVEDQPYWIEQFIKLLIEEKPDAVIIAGDVYDRSAPSAEAVKLLSSLLTKISNLDIPILMVSGNHDSGDKLEFASELLESNKIYISGSINDGKIKCVQLNDEFGVVNFWLMPYIFPALVSSALNDYTIKDYDTAVRRLIANQNINQNERNILIAHQNVTANGVPAERGGSETMVGGVGEIDYTAFDMFDYVALGHIHSSQKIGRKTVRYAGSPLCYHFSELKNPKKGSVVINLAEKDADLKLEIKTIQPLHPLREVKGKFSEIIDYEKNCYGTGEYVKVILTDDIIPENALNSIKTFLETKHSVLMKLSRERESPGFNDRRDSNDVETKTVDELFCDFYFSNRNEYPDEKDMNIISLITEQVNKNISFTDSDIDDIIEYSLSLEKWQWNQ